MSRLTKKDRIVEIVRRIADSISKMDRDKKQIVVYADNEKMWVARSWE